MPDAEVRGVCAGILPAPFRLIRIQQSLRDAGAIENLLVGVPQSVGEMISSSQWKYLL